MDHKSLISSLSRHQRETLLKRENGPGLRHLALHLGALGATTTLVVWQVPLWPMLILPQGLLLVFLFPLMHEATHGTAFRTGWLNRAAAASAGFVLILPAIWFRYFHLAHHRFTNDPDRDPELSRPPPESLWQYLVHLSGIPTWRSQISTLIKNAFNQHTDSFVPIRARAKITAEARLLCLLYAAALIAVIAFNLTMLVWIWFVPLIVAQPFLRAYLLAEHTLCPNVINMLENSRTTITPAVIRWLAWNMPYHAEHHAYPAVPFHRLPELHRLAKPHIKTLDEGYLSVHKKIATTVLVRK